MLLFLDPSISIAGSCMVLLLSMLLDASAICCCLLPLATLPSITPQLAVVLSIVYTVYWQPDPGLFGMSMPLHLYLLNGCGLCLKKGGSPPPPLLDECTVLLFSFSNSVLHSSQSFQNSHDPYTNLEQTFVLKYPARHIVLI